MRGLSRRFVGVAASVAVLLGSMLVAYAVPPADAPRSQTQPLIDGCQRNNTMMLADATPEWVYVDRLGVLASRLAGNPGAGTQRVEGFVTESRVAGEDFYINHDFNDYNADVLPDPAYRSLSGDNASLLHLEWEAPAVPPWVWPEAGDRVVASGAWIWDCGHWGNSAADPTGLSQFVPYDPAETVQDLLDDGAIRGEGTELHPLRELASVRTNAAGRKGADALAGGGVELSRLDVWISSDGGPSLQQLECHLFGQPVWAVARVLCPRYRDVGGSYTYTLPLRPRPSPASEIFVDPVVVAGESTMVPVAPVSVVPDDAAGTVAVSFTLPPTEGLARFGLSVEAGWSDAAPAVAHRVRLDEIHISGSLDGAGEPNIHPGNTSGEQTPGPGEWVLYAGVAGHWVQLPGLQQVTSGQTIPLGLDVDFWLPSGAVPRLFVTGHECDVPVIDCARERFGASAGAPFLEAGFNDRPGRIFDMYVSGGVPVRGGLAMTPGTKAYAPAQGFAGVGNEDYSDFVCGSAGCYQLTATWTTF